MKGRYRASNLLYYTTVNLLITLIWLVEFSHKFSRGSLNTSKIWSPPVCLKELKSCAYCLVPLSRFWRNCPWCRNKSYLIWKPNFFKNPIPKNKKNRKQNKYLVIFQINIFFLKISGTGPWVSRINWCEGHWCGSTYLYAGHQAVQHKV